MMVAIPSASTRPCTAEGSRRHFADMATFRRDKTLYAATCTMSAQRQPGQLAGHAMPPCFRASCFARTVTPHSHHGRRIIVISTMTASFRRRCTQLFLSRSLAVTAMLFRAIVREADFRLRRRQKVSDGHRFGLDDFFRPSRRRCVAAVATPFDDAASISQMICFFFLVCLNSAQSAFLGQRVLQHISGMPMTSSSRRHANISGFTPAQARLFHDTLPAISPSAPTGVTRVARNTLVWYCRISHHTSRSVDVERQL